MKSLNYSVMLVVVLGTVLLGVGCSKPSAPDANDSAAGVSPSTNAMVTNNVPDASTNHP